MIIFQVLPLHSFYIWKQMDHVKKSIFIMGELLEGMSYLAYQKSMIKK